MYRHILVPTDGSALSGRAVQHAVELARIVHARVTFLTVVAPLNSLPEQPYMYGDLPEEFRSFARHFLYADADRALNAASAAATVGGVPHSAVKCEHEHPYRAIIDYADKNYCDVIVMASHGRSGASALLLGSETLKVLTHSKVPVLVCR
jgi:nucleotide-binding universal stress UspA family protein